MTATATAPTASVTLPIGTLQLMRVRYCALAALRQLDYLRDCAWASSPEGRDWTNSLPCGDQDAMLERREAIREQADAYTSLAASIGDAITATGAGLITKRELSRAGSILALCADAEHLYGEERPDSIDKEAFSRFVGEASKFLRSELTELLALIPA